MSSPKYMNKAILMQNPHINFKFMNWDCTAENIFVIKQLSTMNRLDQKLSSNETRKV